MNLGLALFGLACFRDKGDIPLLYPCGIPLWVSDVLPGNVHDLAAARENVLAVLRPRTPRHRNLQRHKVTHDGTEKKRPA
jgi:hypothetical protein